MAPFPGEKEEWKIWKNLENLLENQEWAPHSLPQALISRAWMVEGDAMASTDSARPLAAQFLLLW